MFLPATQSEIKALGWKQPDVILVTGDTYIDSAFMGVSVIGKVLMDKGYKVGVIAQPDPDRPDDICRLGEPALFWGITSGSVDSMVANYTALKKKRKSDDYTPGGQNRRRPDRAVIVYANLIRRYFKNTVPLVLGGIEASLRRCAHYDFWSDSVRRSILFDAKADYLLFGMAHQSVVDLAGALSRGESPTRIRGLAWISQHPAGEAMPSYEQVKADQKAFTRAFELFYRNNDPVTAVALNQAHSNRFVILNPPPEPASVKDLDHIHSLGYERDVHPFYRKQGEVRALDTIRFSIVTHYGCYGECSFCAIAVHQGRRVQSRSETAIVREAEQVSMLPDFKGYITDLSGPTANMYGYECARKLKKGACPDRRCLFPQACPGLKPDHSKLIRLIRRIESLPRIKKVFLASGIRHDLVMADQQHGSAFIQKLVADNVSGQLKLAPEHSRKAVLDLMGKPGTQSLVDFKHQFDDLSEKMGKKQFLTYYLMAAHPGCTPESMQALARFARQTLKTRPRQVQIFTPTPATRSTLMYYTEKDPDSGTSIFVEKSAGRKDQQKQIITARPHPKKTDRTRENPKRKNRYRRRKGG